MSDLPQEKKETDFTTLVAFRYGFLVMGTLWLYISLSVNINFYPVALVFIAFSWGIQYYVKERKMNIMLGDYSDNNTDFKKQEVKKKYISRLETLKYLSYFIGFILIFYSLAVNIKVFPFSLIFMIIAWLIQFSIGENKVNSMYENYIKSEK